MSVVSVYGGRLERSATHATTGRHSYIECIHVPRHIETGTLSLKH